MTQADLRAILVAAGLPAALWQLPDDTYEPITPSRVVDIWAAWVAARPSSINTVRDIGGGKSIQIPKWIAQCGDCDNLALGVMMWADTGNAMAAADSALARGGLALGTLFYTAGPARMDNFQVAGGHAINWFVAHDLSVQFFEPGVGELVTPTTAERSTAWFGLAA